MSTTSPPSSDRRTPRQAGLFFGGLAFVVASALFTRRSIARRYRAASAFTNPPPGTIKPPGSTISKGSPPSSAATGYTSAAAEAEGAGASADAAQAAKETLSNSGPVMALEALTVATVNVLSWAMMLTGGALWALDIGSVDDLRRKVRGGMGVDGTGRSEQEAEEEIEEWLASVLARKEEKKRRRGEEEGGELRNERGKPR